MSELRTLEQRKIDVLAALERNADMWLASADSTGHPHLIAASTWWDGKLLTVATTAASRTVGNLVGTGRARFAVGAPSDVIVIDAELEGSTPAGEAAPDLADGFVRAVGWDPRNVSDGWVLYMFRPTRIQAYRGYGELEGRDVMRHGRWIE
jgi:hypothetical protein